MICALPLPHVAGRGQFQIIPFRLNELVYTEAIGFGTSGGGSHRWSVVLWTRLCAVIRGAARAWRVGE